MTVVDRIKAALESDAPGRVEWRTQLESALFEIERLEAARIAEREMIANTAREWSEHYPQSSDGRNTFILFADWVERRGLEQERDGK